MNFYLDFPKPSPKNSVFCFMHGVLILITFITLKVLVDGWLNFNKIVFTIELTTNEPKSVNCIMTVRIDLTTKVGPSG